MHANVFWCFNSPLSPGSTPAETTFVGGKENHTCSQDRTCALLRTLHSIISALNCFHHRCAALIWAAAASANASAEEVINHESQWFVVPFPLRCIKVSNRYSRCCRSFGGTFDALLERIFVLFASVCEGWDVMLKLKTTKSRTCSCCQAADWQVSTPWFMYGLHISLQYD